MADHADYKKCRQVDAHGQEQRQIRQAQHGQVSQRAQTENQEGQENSPLVPALAFKTHNEGQ